MLVIALCAHVGSSFASSSPRIPAHKTSGLARCSGSVVHRQSQDEVEDARLHGLGDADIAEECC
eukprot:3261269-Pleurochrysis_carterae.AAC.1